MNEMEAHLNEIEAGRRQIANRMSVRSRGNQNHIRANIKLITWLYESTTEYIALSYKIILSWIWLLLMQKTTLLSLKRVGMT